MAAWRKIKTKLKKIVTMVGDDQRVERHEVSADIIVKKRRLTNSAPT